MFELDHDLAQDIVDRTMAILPYNVNVMDSQGLILGSGEAEDEREAIHVARLLESLMARS